MTAMSAAPPPPIAGIILASGVSRRFGAANKLLSPIEGEPIVRRTVRAYLEGGLQPVVVVVGYQAALVGDALAGLPLEIVHNPDFEQGQSRALVRGVHHLPSSISAAVIGVADQPFLTASVVCTLADQFVKSGASVIVPRYAGRQGNPVVFSRSLFPELLTVEGDQGGRPVLRRHEVEIEWVDFLDAEPAVDVDTLDEYLALRQATS
jgi:molybdenum cofactor cytidylyltransferase